jgi:hypothetical protein
MGVRMQLLALEHCWSSSSGSCLTIVLTALIYLSGRLTPVYLPEELVAATSLHNNEELMKGAKAWLSSQAAELSYKDTQLILRYGNCLNSGDDFVEK